MMLCLLRAISSLKAWLSSLVSQLSSLPTILSAIFCLSAYHLVDALFQSTEGDELMHEDILLLADTEGPVGGLVFNRRVPPAVKMEHMVGGGQGEADATGFQRQNERERESVKRERERENYYYLIMHYSEI